MSTGTIKIKQYMKRNIEDHRDPLTNEINMTLLAEDACQHFNDYDNDEIPEVYFDYAFEIAERDERRRSGAIGRTVGGLINSADSSCF